MEAVIARSDRRTVTICDFFGPDEFALKQMLPRKSWDGKNMEGRILMGIPLHPSIVHYFGHREGGAGMELYSESLISYQPLSEYPLPESFADLQHLLPIWIQSAIALDFLNFAQGVYHGDVKGDHILVNGGRVKVFDFDAAGKVGDKNEIACGTIHYTSIEAMQGVHGPYSDQFSLALVVMESITGMILPDEEAPPAKQLMYYYQARRGFTFGCLTASERVALSDTLEYLGINPNKPLNVLSKATNLQPEKRWSTSLAMVEAFAQSLGLDLRTARQQVLEIYAQSGFPDYNPFNH